MMYQKWRKASSVSTKVRKIKTKMDLIASTLIMWKVRLALALDDALLSRILIWTRPWQMVIGFGMWRAVVLHKVSLHPLTLAIRAHSDTTPV